MKNTEVILLSIVVLVLAWLMFFGTENAEYGSNASSCKQCSSTNACDTCCKSCTQPCQCAKKRIQGFISRGARKILLFKSRGCDPSYISKFLSSICCLIKAFQKFWRAAAALACPDCFMHRAIDTKLARTYAPACKRTKNWTRKGFWYMGSPLWIGAQSGESASDFERNYC